MTKESVLGQVVDIKKEPESLQSVTDELRAEMFTLQEVERVQGRRVRRRHHLW